MRVTVGLDGFAQTQSQLGQMKRATQKAVLRRAGLAALQPMAAIAAALAPKDTGKLSNDIAVSARAGGSSIGLAEFGAVLRGGGSKAEARTALRNARRGAAIGDHEVELYMGPVAGTKDDAIKAVVQEFGSSNQPPQPYLRPAFDTDKYALLQRLRPLLWAEIEKTLARTAARAARTGAAG